MAEVDCRAASHFVGSRVRGNDGWEFGVLHLSYPVCGMGHELD